MSANATQSMPLVDQIVAATGLSPVFGRGAIVRALQRAKLDPSAVTRFELRRALPEIEAALKVFFDGAEAARRVRMVEEQLLGQRTG